MESLSKFVGLTTLKAELETFAKSIYMKRLCGRQVGQQGLHMMFIGNPGTGKTTVATAVTGFLHKLQVISKPVPTIVQRGDLVSKYIGQTTEVTRNKIDQSRGGVMVVDEAYRLAQADTSSSKDVGKEALEELMSVMEDGDPIMIFAGYPEEMASFLEVNPGMKSRVAYRFHFHDFSVGELAEIMRFEIANMGLRLSPKADQDLPETIKKTTTKKQRSEMNGRLARQAVVGAEKNMYARCYPNDVDGCKTITQEDLDESLRTFLSGR
ncbi:stage V sporulation protein K-like [Branchiostoma floridae x Branchiostoma belcheri]